MSRTVLTAVLVLAVCGADALAQTRTRAGAEARTSADVRGDGQELDIAAGTRLSAQLESALDVSKARVGDRVILKTTEAIRSQGRTVVNKGARLVGSVTDVRRRASGAAESSITLVFDRLESGKLSAPITANINSVVQASTSRTRGGDDDDEDFGAGASGQATGRAQTSGRGSSSSGGGGGGLLGGVAGTVGGVAETTTRAAGDVVGGTTEAAGRTVGGVGQTLGRVRVTQALGASVEGGSTLSLAGGNLRLEKGTRFNLTLGESAGIGRQ
ncbi:MAG TPA: hypothetical protein VF754_09745 [Pyrinomonadaceae bacterium]